MFPFINILGRQFSSYGLCILIAAICVTLLAVKRAKKNHIGMESIVAIAAISIVVGILGGKLLYIFVTYPLSFILTNIKEMNFDFFKDSGIVFYGGLISGSISAIIGCRIVKVKFSDLADACVPYLPLGHAIGRVGCFLSGCCYGFTYNGPLAITLADGSSHFPIQLVEAFFNILIMLCLLHISKKPRKKIDILSSYLIMYGVLRFCLEFFRGDAIRGVYYALSTSQWISLVLVIFCVLKMCIINVKNKK